MSPYCFFSNDISNPTPSLPPPRLKVLRDAVTKLPPFLTTPTQNRLPLPRTQIIDQPKSSVTPSGPLTQTLRALCRVRSCKLQTQLTYL